MPDREVIYLAEPQQWARANSVEPPCEAVEKIASTILDS